MTESVTVSPNGKVIYGNYEIYGPDGKFIGICQQRRFDWYLKQGIADKLSEKSLKLTFEPNLRQQDDVTCNRIKRENKCYACGKTDDLTRFHVISTEYKKRLPEEWKSRNSLDLLSLCVDCGEDATAVMQGLKDDLEDQYGVHRDDFIDKDRLQLKVMAKKALSHRKHSLDDSILLSKIAKKLNCETVTDAQLKELSTADTTRVHEGCRSVPEYIVTQVIQKGDISTFIRMWKNYFVEKVKPDDLPDDFFYDR